MSTYNLQDDVIPEDWDDYGDERDWDWNYGDDDTSQINVTTEHSLTARGVRTLALLITLGAALAALALHWPL
ncbi:hypothetical protein J4T96_gp108 [Mycobacterium phage Finemlucis]|uniref:Uncharacterized protein n=1 Tax=Mycobacterium phage Finemlucis TaxID=2015844 RepID=A0A291IA28_9CAUD|nr:hypothetical protein J4T96_gp108 [Mycobacterium phage Finemlucis]ATG86540.1 hypothetical protein SEA_FINEMLUCIS_139 [Mycobacterium phage Finemlucis]QGZ16637.1 hypothetical protein PBI_GABRIELA_141 [Mycobacterium phage Gabriela]